MIAAASYILPEGSVYQSEPKKQSNKDHPRLRNLGGTTTYVQAFAIMEPLLQIMDFTVCSDTMPNTAQPVSDEAARDPPKFHDNTTRHLSF